MDILVKTRRAAYREGKTSGRTNKTKSVYDQFAESAQQQPKTQIHLPVQAFTFYDAERAHQ